MQNALISALVSLVVGALLLFVQFYVLEPNSKLQEIQLVTGSKFVIEREDFQRMEEWYQKGTKFEIDMKARSEFSVRKFRLINSSDNDVDNIQAAFSADPLSYGKLEAFARVSAPEPLEQIDYSYSEDAGTQFFKADSNGMLKINVPLLKSNEFTDIVIYTSPSISQKFTVRNKGIAVKELREDRSSKTEVALSYIAFGLIVFSVFLFGLFLGDKLNNDILKTVGLDPTEILAMYKSEITKQKAKK